MPTAMPVVPLSSRCGRRAGIQVGSSSVPSKFGVPVDRALAEFAQQDFGDRRQLGFGVAHRRERLRDRRCEPKLPWPSISG